MLSCPKKGKLPSRKLSRHVSYVKDATAIYKIHNNLNLSLMERQLVIDVKAGVPEDGRNPVEVGLFKFLLDNIEKRCPSDQSWIDASSCLDLDGSAFKSSIKISARKRKVDRDYVSAKKEEAIRALRSQVDCIERFNQDPNIPQRATLSANVRGIGGISLLHAALQLSNDSALVERLLSLGADPKAESIAGTPLTFAEDLVLRARSKLETTKRSGAPPPTVAARETRLAQAEKIFRIMEHHESTERRKKSPAPVVAKRISFADEDVKTKQSTGSGHGFLRSLLPKKKD
jgi:hypothetical protein